MDRPASLTPVMKPARDVAILIFDEVEVLDFAGPFEIFSVTGRQKQKTPFHKCPVIE
jgi:putative intracellular protease/amidase